MMSSIGFAQSDKVKEAKDDLIMRTPSSADDPLKSITIHQQIDFNASPQQLYEALLDAKQFTEFSDRPAEINREVGGAFSLFKGHIVGRNVELVPNQRIVQAWRVVTWPEGAYSIARFELSRKDRERALYLITPVFRKAYTIISPKGGRRIIGRCSRGTFTDMAT